MRTILYDTSSSNMVTLNTYLLGYSSYTSKCFCHKHMVMMCLAHLPYFWNTILALLFCTWLPIVLLLINYEVLVHHIMILRWIIYDLCFYHVSRHILFLSLLLTSHDWLNMVYTTTYNSELSLTINCFTCLDRFYILIT